MASAAWLAATKLTPPARRRDALFRKRLIDAVGRSFDHSRLTLISAPAGAGKTTLLAELPSAFPEIKFCWLLLDAEDNDLSRFTAALVASLEAAGLPLQDEIGPAAEPRQIITFLINRIAERQMERWALVLDDLHVITERSVLDLLDYLIDRLPGNFHVVLATRHDPSMSLARLRARGDVGEIRIGELSFTEEEAGRLANDCLGLGLTDPEVAQLHSRTEGWAAGLRLLATSLTQSPNQRGALLQSGMQGSRRIFDFLAEEVLDQQPEEVRRFLLETSILSSLRPEVCNALTGRRDSLMLLEDLYRRNLYVVAADETESAFRYHDLFADFLRERLRRERPADWNALQVRAAQAEVSPHDRLRHLLAGQAWEEAAAEIERIGPEYAFRGFVATLLRWIQELPEDVRNRHPRILYLLGQTIWTQSEFAKAQPYIEKALEAFRRSDDVVGQGEALIALANSALMLNELDKCRELLKEGLTYDIPASSRVQLHSAAAWEAIYRQDWPEAMQHIDEVYALLEIGEGRTNPLATMLVLFSEGIPGYLNKIDATCRLMQQQVTGVPDILHANYHMLRGAVHLHRGEMEPADEAGYRAMKIAQDCGQVQLILAALCTSFAVTAAHRGDWAEMDEWASKGCDESKHGQIARNWRLHSLYFQARARWHSGDIDGLRRTYEAAMAPNPVEAPAAAAYRSLIRGMMRMTERAYAQAEQAFRDAMREEDGFKVTRAVASAKVFLAYLLFQRGRTAEAMEVFLPYLEETEQYNIPGQIMYHNPIVQPLLRYAHERNIRRPFVERVLDAMGAPLNAMEATGGEALSEREMEVLRVMAEGLGNREIGERLFVSESTVKTHVQRILRKLDAASRTQAVNRARELMLI